MVTTTYELGILSGAFTGAANREDLLDVITMISPVSTPCFTQFRKTKISNVATEWLTDALATPTSNAKVEGSTAEPVAVAARVRLKNYAQISRWVYEISDTQRSVNPAGVADEYTYQMGKALKQLKQDIEWGILNGTSSTGGAASTRCAAGILAWIAPVANSGTTNSGHTGAAATGGEAAFNLAIQEAWLDGGEVDYALVTPYYKGQMSSYWAGSQGTNRVMPADSHKITSVIDVYQSDFGQVAIYPHRMFSATNNTKIAVLEKAKWMVGLLRPIKNTPLAKLGSSTNAMVEAEWTLICLHPSANAWVSAVPSSN